MANVLIVDASSAFCSATLVTDDGLFDIAEQQPRRHAQRLLPMIDEVVQQAGISKRQIDGVAYARGPGSFTGIRIAVSVVQGMALGLELPVYGFSTLQLLAWQAAAGRQLDRIACVMDAHMGEVFWGVFEHSEAGWTLTGTEQVGAPDVCVGDLSRQLQQQPDCRWMLAGNGLKLLPAGLPELPCLAELEPLSRYAAELVQQAWQSGQFGDMDAYPPVYLRDSVAWKKLDEQPSLLKRN
ncbi:tRNA (adenosine(37)-N6)-threonylcarbamoyltransferase complex dimerization subunit type 1 TsaB [Oceanobacter mangrovi]|uniref:tRNA (adenosine(37)-N6)-threonylcarbamoyltransferase complex dimerization subunit type 1 TsaB n=1 Tax=Oceanobacter mangrovi TaxID=2862510 RepID=UPI001C8ED4BD|nr:tRNA (adenosine(37)-N6)-threonylcarbamoyltransferase complex dimerization subunit type 1 TsaB [Oceanobacter mangrovi]